MTDELHAFRHESHPDFIRAKLAGSPYSLHDHSGRNRLVGWFSNKRHTGGLGWLDWRGPFECFACVCGCFCLCVFDGHCAAEAMRSSLCRPAALILYLSYLKPGKVNEVLVLLEEVKMGWLAETRESSEMKRATRSGSKWQFWWITETMRGGMVSS